MTLGDIVDVVRRVEFCGALRLLMARLHVDPAGGHAFRLTATITVPERDTNRSTELVQFDHIHLTADMRSLEFLHVRINALFRRMLAHEVDENIVFDGRRLFDPHRQEPRMVKENFIVDGGVAVSLDRPRRR